MSTGTFPSDSHSRKAVYVLQKHDIEKCAYEPGAGQVLLDEEAYVLPFPIVATEDRPTALQNILDADLARPGRVLVQSPYDPNSYEDAADAPQRFALAKHMYFARLCALLGATEVSVEQIDLRSRSTKISMSAGGDVLGKDGQVEATLDEIEKLRTKMTLAHKFKGAPPNIEAARNLLRKYRLGSDPGMRGLVDMMEDGGNQMVEQKLTISLSSEAKNNLNVVARLNLPSFVKLSAEYDRVTKEQYDLSLTVLVKF